MSRICSRHGLVLAIIFLVLQGVTSPGANGTEDTVKQLAAFQLTGEEPIVDGSLSEPIWSSPSLQLGRDFIQRNPDDGAQASESTLVAIAYGAHSVYVGFWCYDSEPDKIARLLVRRDRYSQSDHVGVRLDGFHDHKSGYGFIVSAAGVQQDWRIYNDGWSDDNWDAVWTAAVQMQPWGWTAEMEIPYHCLRFPDLSEQVWGVNFSRVINRRDEDSWWSPLSESESGFVSKFGHLTGLSGIQPARHLEVMPFGVANFETEREKFTNPDGKSFYGNIGVDVKYGLSSNLTLDATLNPDFGQVELDQPVLNLSTYETWFGERRPFFVEGSDLFNTRINLFYSRRVGRQPRGDVDDPSFLRYSGRLPKSTTILGAAKLTGKLSGGTSVALLTAITQEEKREYEALLTSGSVTDTVSREGVIEPLAGYSAFRIQQDISRRSQIGGLVTVASQGQSHPAVTGGLDWRLFTNNRMWSLCGQIVGSRVDDEKVGFGADIDFEKESGKHVRFAIGTEIYDQHLELNHLGYLRRSNSRAVWTWWQYRTSDDWWIIRNSWNNLNWSRGWNYAHEEIQHNWNFNNHLEFVNYWHGGLSFGGNRQKYDDRETRGRGTWSPPKTWWASVWLDTDERRKFQVELDYTWGESRTSPWWTAEVLFRLKPSSNFEVWTQVEYVHDYGQLRWVDNSPEIDGTSTDSTLFAWDNQDVIEIEFGATLTLSTNLSVQFSAEGLSSGLDYFDYRVWQGGDRYGDVYSESRLTDEYDYLYSALNSMFLVRWEFKPGSTLYAVWTRSRWENEPGTSGFVFDRDFDRFVSGVPAAPSDGDVNNVFLIKASYWLNI